MVCDLAETYHIYNYEELPPSQVGVLLFGLRDNSRTKMFLNGQKLTLEQTLLAMLVDDLNFIAWTKTKDAQHKRNRPKSVLDALTKEKETMKDELMSFGSVAEYEAYMQAKRGKGKNDGSDHRNSLHPNSTVNTRYSRPTRKGNEWRRCKSRKERRKQLLTGICKRDRRRSKRSCRSYGGGSGRSNRTN